MKRLIFSIVAATAICASAIDHKTFGRIVTNDTSRIEYAPSYLVVNGIYTGEALLTTNDYLNAKWRSLVDIPPQTDSNHYSVAIGWKESGESWIYRVYDVRELPPPPPRRFYKYDISVAAMEYGEITNLVTFISADVGVKWMWDAAEIIVESDPYFVAATNDVISSGVVTSAKVSAILDRAWQLGQEPEASK